MREGGCDQSIGSTVFDAIVSSWLWLTATRSTRLGYFSTLLQVVDFEPTFCGSIFSTGRLLAIEDFTFFLLLSSSIKEGQTCRQIAQTYPLAQILDS